MKQHMKEKSEALNLNTLYTGFIIGLLVMVLANFMYESSVGIGFTLFDRLVLILFLSMIVLFFSMAESK